MNIGLHIAEILEERGKVSVPGVGTFYLKTADAFFDEQRQLFFPKNQELSFKLSEEEDDSIFPDYISKSEEVPFTTAQQSIKEFAVKVNAELGTSGNTEIAGVGNLKKSGSGYTIETFSSYGLMPLPESEYESSDFSNAASLQAKEESVVNEKSAEESAEENINDESAIVEEKKRSSLLKWLIISLAALLLISSPLGYYFYPQIKEMINGRQPSTEPAVLTPLTPAPLTPGPVDSLADSTTVQQTDSIRSAAQDVINPDSAAAGITYEIIIASFSVKNEAESYMSQLAAKGLKAQLIERPSGTFKYKVSVGSFNDQGAAQNALSLVQKNINKEAWIAKIKN